MLVDPARREQGRDVLRGLGYVDASEQLGIDDVGGVVHAETWAGMTAGSDRELAIDFHHWLPGAGTEPGAVWREIWPSRSQIELEGQPVAVPSRAALALGIATHLAQHGPEYEKGIRDLTVALERWPAELWRQSAGLAQRIGATEVFAAGLRLTTEGADMARELQLPDTTQLDWEIRNRHSRPRGTFHLDAVLGAGSLRERLGVVRRALFPRRAWIVSQHPWAWQRGGIWVLAAYLVHLLRAPIWAARAVWFKRRRTRSGP